VIVEINNSNSLEQWVYAYFAYSADLKTASVYMKLPNKNVPYKFGKVAHYATSYIGFYLGKDKF